MIDSDFLYVYSVSFFLMSLVIMECPAFAVMLNIVKNLLAVYALCLWVTFL